MTPGMKTSRIRYVRVEPVYWFCLGFLPSEELKMLQIHVDNMNIRGEFLRPPPGPRTPPLATAETAMDGVCGSCSVVFNGRFIPACVYVPPRHQKQSLNAAGFMVFGKQIGL